MATGDGPIAGGERSALLDALRGWALLGILIANMPLFLGYHILDDDRRAMTVLAELDPAVEFLIEWLIVGKFYGLFSLLFGIGFAIQLDRLEQRGEGIGRYLRRLLILFAIGIGHMLLLWRGDIVALYAAMGAVLLLFRVVSDRALLLWAVLLWAAALAWAALIAFVGFEPAAGLRQAGRATIAAAGFDLDAGPLALLAGPDFLPHLRSHPGEILLRLGRLVHELRPVKVLGMFLIGLWIGRHALYANPAAHSCLLRRAAVIGLSIGVPLSAAKAAIVVWSGEASPGTEFYFELFYVLSTPSMAVGLAAVFALLWARGPRHWQSWSAPAGRMALTNYLMQTVLQSALFYGWGAGLIGKLGLVFVVPLSLALFAFQLAYSRWWLARFRFGPVEWLWRSLTYGRAQPMRNDRASVRPE